MRQKKTAHDVAELLIARGADVNAKSDGWLDTVAHCGTSNNARDASGITDHSAGRMSMQRTRIG